MRLSSDRVFRRINKIVTHCSAKLYFTGGRRRQFCLCYLGIKEDSSEMEACRLLALGLILAILQVSANSKPQRTVKRPKRRMGAVVKDLEANVTSLWQEVDKLSQPVHVHVHGNSRVMGCHDDDPWGHQYHRSYDNHPCHHDQGHGGHRSHGHQHDDGSPDQGHPGHPDWGSHHHDHGYHHRDHGSHPHDHGSRDHDHGSHDHGSHGHDHGSRDHDHGSRDRDHGSRDQDHGSRDRDHGSKDHDRGSKDHDHGSRDHDHGSRDRDHHGSRHHKKGHGKKGPKHHRRHNDGSSYLMYGDQPMAASNGSDVTPEGRGPGNPVHHDQHGTHVHIHLHALLSEMQGEARGGSAPRDVYPVTQEYRYARCDVVGNSELPLFDFQDIQGFIYFRQMPGDPLELQVDLQGFVVDWSLEGDHHRMRGMHVHAFGDMSSGCTSMGGHFNPGGTDHGGPGHHHRHPGDFGNLFVAEDGSVVASMSEDKGSLFGDHSLLGRGIVIHGGADDLGQGGNNQSKASGNAGARIACCTIVATGAQSGVWDFVPL